MLHFFIQTWKLVRICPFHLQIKYLSIAGLIWTKIRHFDEILDEIGDFGRTKNDILDNIFLVSLILTFVHTCSSVITSITTRNFATKIFTAVSHWYIAAICRVLLLGISGIGMWSRPGLSPTHGQCCYVVVVPLLLCGSPCALLAAAAVANGNVADVIPWRGVQENSGAEWRWREIRPETRGLWSFPPRARWRTDSLAQQVWLTFTQPIVICHLAVA